MSPFDVVIVGAGPTGLACAIACKEAGLNSMVLDKGCITNSIYHFPANMVFFTSSDLLEVGGLPFTSPNAKPTREEGLQYYKRAVQHFGLSVHTSEKVLSILKKDEGFEIAVLKDGRDERTYRSEFVILATGYYDNPNMLNVEGEDLPKVSHYYSDPHPFFDKEVMVVGGKNSACIAALELFRYGSRVTVVHRGDEIKQSVKYWILPDFLNRVKEGSIKLYVETVVERIGDQMVFLKNLKNQRVQSVANDHVFALTGYHPDVDFLSKTGISVDPKTMVPHCNEQTLETNVPGLYVAGSISAGRNTNKLFIENGRFHGKTIVSDVVKKLETRSKH